MKNVFFENRAAKVILVGEKTEWLVKFSKKHLIGWANVPHVNEKPSPRPF